MIIEVQMGDVQAGLTINAEEVSNVVYILHRLYIKLLFFIGEK
jgi:hypothetical protein